MAMLSCLGLNESAPQVESAATHDEEVREPDPFLGEILPVADQWREAIRQHDAAGILRFASPEDHDFIKKALEANDSPLNRNLYAGDLALDRFFRKRLDEVVIRHKRLLRLGRGTTVCFCDPKLLSQSTSKLRLPETVDPEAVRCFFLAFDSGRWVISFGFAYPD